MVSTRSSRASIYSLLQVHPAAPLELITAVYWRLIGRARISSRGEGAEANRVRQLERAYKVLSDPEKRAAYDSAMNIQAAAGIPEVIGDGLATKRADGDGSGRIDYYDLLRVDPAAGEPGPEEGCTGMRELSQTVINEGRATPKLLDLLDEAFRTVSEPASRRRYDSQRVQVEAPVRPPGSAGAIGIESAPTRQRSRIDRESLLFNTSMIASALSALCIIVGMVTASLDLSDYGIVNSFPLSFYVG